MTNGENWRLDDPELESEEAAQEGMKKKRRQELGKWGRQQ